MSCPEQSSPVPKRTLKREGMNSSELARIQNEVTQTTQEELFSAMHSNGNVLRTILVDDEEVAPSPLDIIETDGHANIEPKHKDTTIFIGYNQTKINKEVFLKINWDSYSFATRGLMDAVFDKETMAKSTLTGVSSKLNTKMLDPRKVSDIVKLVHDTFHVSAGSIRRVISTKCCALRKQSNSKDMQLMHLSKRK